MTNILIILMRRLMVPHSIIMTTRVAHMTTVLRDTSTTKRMLRLIMVTNMITSMIINMITNMITNTIINTIINMIINTTIMMIMIMITVMITTIAQVPKRKTRLLN